MVGLRLLRYWVTAESVQLVLAELAQVIVAVIALTLQVFHGFMHAGQLFLHIVCKGLISVLIQIRHMRGNYGDMMVNLGDNARQIIGVLLVGDILEQHVSVVNGCTQQPLAGGNNLFAFVAVLGAGTAGQYEKSTFGGIVHFLVIRVGNGIDALVVAFLAVICFLEQAGSVSFRQSGLFLQLIQGVVSLDDAGGSQQCQRLGGSIVNVLYKILQISADVI